ncbi:MAG: hypothetical protein FJY88_00855 [Candidatus Eisenbacteria bacterium]|nr:hypothetical protein [Candidatus Eisenbacteria bacterium]
MPGAGWLRGYRRSISGEKLSYHSPYPDAATALLVRATDGGMRIEWESEPVPVDAAGPSTFLWMCGLATQKGAHAFHLSVGGRPVLCFRTGKDASERCWEIEGEDGARLRFLTTMVDQFDELFGFMWLVLPPSMIEPGKPVVIGVTGEKGESQDWYMVFEYDLQPWVRASGEEALVREGGRLLQLLRVEVSHLGPPRGVSLSSESSRGRIRSELTTGYNIFHLPIEPAGAETELEVTISIEGEGDRVERARVRPVEKREIYLLPHSHLDIGYSDPQPVVERKHWGYFEQALELSERSAGNPPGARFKWNVENLWAVETFLRQAPPEIKESFFRAARDGRIGLQALLANELTGICHPEEILKLTEFARRLAGECGVRITSAMITDIPSYTWNLVPALAQGGVRYLSSGPNYMPRLPDGGDRIGYALKTWGDRPFYWISPSGTERVLLWMTGRGYSWFHGLNTGKIGSAAERSILDYMRELADAGYPYAMVQVRYTIGGDNGPPDPELADFVKSWNERFESPRMAIATSQELFEEFEARYGDRLPEVRGDFTPYWEDGVASSARETAVSRRSAERLLQAQALWSILRADDYPAEEFYEAWRHLLLFDEHTWGAADSVSDPDGENARAQWAWKEALAAEGARRADRLLRSSLDDSLAGRAAAPGRDGSRAIEVFNTRAWRRTEVVLVPRDLCDTGDLVLDDAGAPVPSQRLSTGDLAILASGVPGLGMMRYRVQRGSAFQGDLGVLSVEPSYLENDRIRATLDPETGAVSSLVLKGRPDIECADQAAGNGLNAYLHLLGHGPERARGARRARARVKESGPLVASLRVEAEAPGCRSLAIEYTLHAGADRLLIVNEIDKERVREKESVHFAFPFRIPGGVFRLDLGWVFIRPEEDQIPGACRDFFCLHNTADLSGDRAGITFVALDVPLVEIGRITDESPVAGGTRAWRRAIEPTQTVFSYAMNNYWHTNYKADQEGRADLRYAVRPHRVDGCLGAKKTGMELSQPLVVRRAGGGQVSAEPLLEIEGETVVLTSIAPLEDGAGWLVRLHNVSESPGAARLGGMIGRECAVYRSDLDEARYEPIDGSFAIPPWGIATLRAERRAR